MLKSLSFIKSNWFIWGTTGYLNTGLMILQQNLKSFSYQLELTGVFVKLETPFFFPSLCISQSLNQFAFYSYIHPFFVVHTTCPLSAWSCLGHNLVAFSPCVPPVPRSRFVRWFCSFSACLFHISSICWEKGEPRWFLLWMGNTFLSVWKDFQN